MALTWIPWDVAAASGAVVGTAGVAGRAATRPWITKIAAFLRELAVVLVLYAMWRVVATVSVMKVDGAINAGQSIWDFERAVGMPNERTLQELFMHSSPLIQLCNWYYASFHIPTMLVFLVWLWVRHRDVYPPIRNVIALATLWCLAVQLIPVAPPRLVPDLHVQDTPALFGQTVYPSFGKDGPAQLSAMPSVHVAWAVIIGIAIVIASKSKWRWIFLAHPVLTIIVVVVTGNHYWLDGIVAIGIIALAVPFESWCRRSVKKLSRSQSAPSQMPIRSMTEASSE